MNLRNMGIASVFFLAALAARGQEVIRLYPGAAPGTEEWTGQEKEYFSALINTQVVTNVTEPTLTAYLPAPDKATGTGVIIAPGGGFHFLSINSEGVEVAQWLNAHGVAAFVLKYRLVPTGEDGVKDLMAMMGTPEKAVEKMAPVIPFAGADGLAAVRYVREHAAKFGVAPDKIGFIGFSAGGAVTCHVMFHYDAQSRPNFVAPIYAGGSDINEAAVPADAPPMFVVVATDDQLGLAKDSVTLYGKWIDAKKPAELHAYARGGHGFGMRKQDLPSDTWIERYGDWLSAQGLMAKR